MGGAGAVGGQRLGFFSVDEIGSLGQGELTRAPVAISDWASTQRVV